MLFAVVIPGEFVRENQLVQDELCKAGYANFIADKDFLHDLPEQILRTA